MAEKRLTCLLVRGFYVFICSLVIIVAILSTHCNGNNSEHQHIEEEQSLPTVFVAILVRNKAHTLPWFLGHLELINYPKEKIALWIRSDHNIDNSTAILNKWIKATEHMYNSVEFVFDDTPTGFAGEIGPCHWTIERFNHVIQLRQKAIKTARNMWADYLLMIDADVMLENPDTLKLLIDQQKTLIAPVMNASVGDTYSNFWGGMDEQGYYKRVPEYFKMLEREIQGVFQVPMIHTVFLMDLRHTISEKLSYIAPPGYNMPEDDIIIFALSAQDAGVPMYILNTEYFGHVMVPLDEYHTLFIEDEQFTLLRMEMLDADNPETGPGVDYIVEGRGLIPSPYLDVPMKPKDRLGFDKVYMINLQRRSERRNRMLYVFDVLGIEAELIPAVDGKLINASYLKTLDIKILPGFSDPVKGRPMTMGEIGCFLSHYFIWKDMVEKGYSEVVVFEDDLRFEPYFRTKLRHIMRQVKEKVPDWDLIYLGRKRLNRKDESYLSGSETLVWPSYSYWTLSYLLSSRGAKKLLAQKPLQKLLPVDEYLPVMFNKHPEESWKEPFHPRDLIALSAEPLLIYPTHYLGEAHYISDTEWSELITEKTNHNSAEEPQRSPTADGIGDHQKGDHLGSSNRQQDEL
ncbi:procollagen galactosyltransferase 1-like isoform X2 [Ruditapes philippinarum]|uniref:procollagen galactosyltransferase 1-like isoform X2 n=1 Tax=Ruditapes philippinarum TaxID=129788 RepID=UPI00295A5F74|nr:procollagen galactosyltransferase 1-like isoform X2 [Ruditapes philippinarum]